jgi:competence protein ComEC
VLSASLAAQLTVDPLIALYFNKISIIAIISNLIVVPFTGIVTILGFVMSIVGLFSIFLAKLTGGLTYFFLTFMLWASEVTAKVPFATIQVITPGLLFIIGYYVLLYLLLYYIPVKKPSTRFYKTFWVSLGLTALLFAVTLVLPKPLQINFIDIGQGDCCFIKTPSSKTILIDGGGAYPGSTVSFDPGETLIPFILDNAKTSIDIAILSHPHGDHIQGLIEVADAMNLKRLVIGPQFQQNEDLNKLLEICRRKKVEILQVSKGDNLSIDGVRFDFLYPSLFDRPEDTSDLNKASLVAMLYYRNIRALFTGDIPSTSEEEILASNADVHADIFKVPHHGSVYSSSSKFLQAVSPSTCVISVGKNTFGHPAPAVLDRIKSVHAAMYRTDLNGGIKITVYDSRYTVTPTVN